MNLSIQTSMLTTMSLIKGDILNYLEKRGLATQEQILKALDWPSLLITMAVGALIRDDIIRAKQFNGEMVIYEIPRAEREFDQQKSPDLNQSNYSASAPN